MSTLNFQINPTQVATAIERLRPMPWRGIVWTVTGSFLAASAASTIIGYLIMGQTTPAMTKRSAPDAEFSWQSGPTLSKLQIDKVLERNIFNSEGQMGDVSEGGMEAGKPVKTTLPIKVVGIIYPGNPFNGLAMVENSQNHTVSSFLVGDPLLPDPNAMVKEIHVDQILIENAGRTEYAPLEEPEIRRSSRKGKKPTTKKAEGLTSLGGSGYATEPPPENYKEDGFERKGYAIEMTAEYKSRLLGPDFASVLQDAKASPNLVDGVLKGWKMDRIRKGSIYEKAGVQNNDIVEEINGVVLSDAGQAIKTLQNLKNEENIELRINRDGKPLTISFKVR
jgi:type II secretion system protein C